ncbi:MAG: family 78 glycoside hydrolase catalytic domain [Prolixibacteraceae bacterium]|nr:family 78 glycoside hydrolase catalytic domain [Prolixibacteraceae bacterium]
MNRLKISFQTIALLFILSAFSSVTFAKTEVVKLVTEYHVNPIGIDIEKPRLSWQLISDEENVMQTAYEIRVAGSLSDLYRKSKQIWTSAKVMSDKSVNIVYGGPALKSMQRVYWQVRVWDNKTNKASSWSKPAFWEMGILETASWTASWITLPNEKMFKGISRPAQYYRNEFAAAKKVKSARVYVTSLGLYKLYLNGEKVGDQLFTPGWTSYNKRLQYQTYDVTSMLQRNNAIGAVLGDGWYRGNIGWGGQHSYYGDKLALLLQLIINYTDGTSEIITTNKNWKVSNGPIVKSDIYNGELYDARLEMDGWKNNGFDDNSWEKVKILKHTKDNLVAPQGVPVKAVEELKAIKQITTPKGEMVFDMGQNMVGWLRIKLKGNIGDTVKIKFAEVLDKEGNFYTANLRSAKATDTYIFKSNDDIVYEPNFTFHGFRFVKLEGVSKAPGLDDITGVVIHSAMNPTGTFSCSDSLINQLQHNIQWGQKGNFLDVPTDCPQRDERLGWTGDAQVFSMTAAYNFNVAPFYTKWMKDVAADQLPNGKITHVVPDVLKGGGGSTGWADVVAIIPWTVYRVYGDKRILETSYQAITKWVDYMTNRAGDDYLWTGDSHFGDWLAFASTRSDYPGATTEKDLIATAYYYYTSNLTSKIASIIGKNFDADKYKEQAKKIKAAFINEFVTPNGRLVSHTQTAYALALAFGLLPDNLVEKAGNYLAGDVTKFKHLTTGFLGTPLLCKTLSAVGRDDLAYLLLNRKEYPSWLYPVTQGATTIWERWDGQKPDGSFQNIGMNSFNHYAYGAIGEWLYSYVAGINIDVEKPGYKHILLSPHFGGGLNDVDATFMSIHGEITSAWKIDENGWIVYLVEVPANTTATVTLPEAYLESLKVNSELATEELKSKATQNNNNLVVEIGSGKYLFKYPYEVK